MTYKIMGRYRGEVEEVDDCEDKREAERLAREYRIAFGEDWGIWIEEGGEDET